MKSFNLILAAILVPLMVVFTGCGAENVRNVSNAPVQTSSKSISLDKVTKAIQSAGSTLGWSVRLVKPGHIDATIHLRKHMAKVAIKYSTKSYSITYVDSENLNYDGTVIHKNYNGWIINLDSGIKQRLSVL